MERLGHLVGEGDVERLQLTRLLVGAQARGRDEEVEQHVLAVRRVDEHEAAGAGPGQRGLAHPRHQHRRDGRVDGVAARA
jgi:hypothetical protein